MKLLCIFLLLMGSLYSCTKTHDPENILREYIGYRFSENQSRGQLLEMTTGELQQNIEAMNDDEFAQFVNVSRYIKKDVRILTNKCTEAECYITYILKYDIVVDDKNKTHSAEIKKVAKLMNVDGDWKVADVNNIKTFFDSQKAIDIPAE